MWQRVRSLLQSDISSLLFAYLNYFLGLVRMTETKLVSSFKVPFLFLVAVVIRVLRQAPVAVSKGQNNEYFILIVAQCIS